MGTFREASFAVEIIVVGGSIAGLATAYALAKAGHQVLVLEQSDGVGKGIGGVRVPPNMNRLLVRWGLGPELDRLATTWTRSVFHIAATGEPIGYLESHEEVRKVLEADIMFMQHRDVHQMLYDIAIDAGVEVRFNTRVSAINPWNATVTLADGETTSCDLIVGADGYQSMVREVVVEEPVRVRASGSTCFSVTLPTSIMKQDEELLSLTELDEWSIWMGPGTGIIGYLTHAKEYYCLHLFWNDPDFQTFESWEEEVSLDRLDFTMYESRVRKMMKIAGVCTPTKHIIHEPLDHWVHRSNKVVLVGEAAHPLIPGTAHGAAMCVEDAATLGNLFGRLHMDDQIPSLLSAFEDLRQDRCNTMQRSEREKIEFVSLPHGPGQEARDAGLRSATASSQKDWDDSEDSYLREQWEEFRDLFGYEANDAADDWWVQWGMLRERAAHRHSTGIVMTGIQVSVATVGS